VFICDLSQVERSRLERRLDDILNPNLDAAVLLDLGPANQASARCFSWLGGVPSSG
jgi:hypothetical protein